MMVCNHNSDQRAPPAPPTSTVHQAQRLWNCAQACGANHPTPDHACCDHQCPPWCTMATAIRGSQHHPYTTFHWAGRPWHCVQEHSADCPMPRPAHVLHQPMHHHHPLPVRDAAHVTHLLAMLGQWPQHCVQVHGTGAVPAHQYDLHDHDGLLPPTMANRLQWHVTPNGVVG